MQFSSKPTLLNLIKSLYPSKIDQISGLVIEAESSDYGACRFTLNGCSMVFRIAKTTPTKIGQFVTLWKRPQPDGPIAPLDSKDNFDFVVVYVSDENKLNQGHFTFSKEILLTHGVISSQEKGGKRAIRVYPPWSKPTAKDAIKTQRWQLLFFK
jgi:hypothetical protein